MGSVAAGYAQCGGDAVVAERCKWVHDTALARSKGEPDPA